MTYSSDSTGHRVFALSAMLDPPAIEIKSETNVPFPALDNGLFQISTYTAGLRVNFFAASATRAIDWCIDNATSNPLSGTPSTTDNERIASTIPDRDLGSSAYTWRPIVWRRSMTASGGPSVTRMRSGDRTRNFSREGLLNAPTVGIFFASSG